MILCNKIPIKSAHILTEIKKNTLNNQYRPFEPYKYTIFTTLSSLCVKGEVEQK